jgi:hypothetical protein
MRKLVALVACFVALTALNGCLFPMGGGAKFDAQMMLGAYVMPNVKAVYVDVAKAKAGESAKKDMGAAGTQTVAVIEVKDDLTLVELTGSNMKNGDKATVVAMWVDKDGNVKKAYGGVADTEGTELKVPEPPKTEATPAAAPTDQPAPKIEDLPDATIVGITAKGKKVTVNVQGKDYVSSTWTNTDFAFFGGVMKMESSGMVIEVKEYNKEGAKAQLKPPAEKK